MLASESINELSKSLCAAQAEMVNPPLNKKNPYYKSSYADLTCVIDTIRAPMTKNGLSFTQCVEYIGDRLVLNTVLLHSSGQWLASHYPLLPAKPSDPQSLGSCITYAKRYSLMALLGISGDEDDDANSEVVNEMTKKIKPVIQEKPKPSIRYISDSQLQELDYYFSQCTEDFQERIMAILKKEKVDSFKSLPSDQFDRWKKAFQKNLYPKISHASVP